MDETGDLKPQFKVEYAKSNRSTCKKCRSAIPKDSVRAGKLTIAENFDGEIYVWRHLKCFFTEFLASVTSSSELKGILSLRWPDQEKIRAYFPGEASAPASSASAEDDSAGDEGSEDSVSFSAEYAKSGRAKCKQCSNTIENKSLRIGRSEVDEGTGYTQQGWYHLACVNFPSWITIDLVSTPGISAPDKQLIQDRVNLAAAKKSSSSSSSSSSSAGAEGPGSEQAKLKEQIRKEWQKRDMLEREYTTAQLKRMLRENDMSDKGGTADLVSRIADAIINGAVPRCPKCKGRMQFDRETGFKCRGYASSWSKCTYSSMTAERIPWKMPNWEEEEPVYEEEEQQEGGGGDKSPQPGQQDELDEIKMPLEGMTFAIVGNVDDRDGLVEKIEANGGSVSANVTKKVTHVISSHEEITATSKLSKLKTAVNYGIPLHEVSFITNLIASASKVGQKRSRSAGLSSSSAAEAPPAKRFKLKKKRTGKIDSFFEEDASEYHVIPDGEDVYDATMNLADLTSGPRGRNTFYVMQLLAHNTRKKFVMFTRWGRVGEPGYFTTKEFTTQNSAINAFKDKYFEKTGNNWEDRDDFVKKPGKFLPIELDEDDESSQLQTGLGDSETSDSILDRRVRKLVALIFDMKMFESTMKSMNFDVKKMPLGKLSKEQLNMGMSVLAQIEAELQKFEPDPFVLSDRTNEFYTVIPHFFGAEIPPIINTLELVKKKFEHIEVLGDIQVAAEMIKQKTDDELKNDPFYAKYKLLKNDIVPIDKQSEEYNRIQTYINNTLQSPKLELMDAFKVEREGERQRFAQCDHIEHRKLLWHGSRVAVFASILSGGMKIMPHSGGRVGKGLYFADVISKSSAYCETASLQGGGGQEIGLMLLNEVALGKIHKINRDDSSLVRAPPGFNSILATGTINPRPEDDYKDTTLSNSGHPVYIPQGKIVNTKINSSFYHNEFLVYDESQVNMKYLLMLKWP